MKKSEQDIIEILLKNIINMHEKLNIINEKLALEEDFKGIPPITTFKKQDVIVEIDKNTYEQMCDMMGSGVIPFMGIA